MNAYEKLGTFYLGKSYDLDSREQKDDLILYDSKDLTTHAVIIGMTGSGKTGLGISMLEEAAIDKIPVIAIDPKGDLGNCLLNFPQLDPSDFEPWVDPQEAANKGMTKAQFAASQAQLWEKGIQQWDQDKARIQRLRDAVDMSIYTPGSNAGLPVSVLKSFTAPPEELREVSEVYSEQIQATATSILTLLGIDADPLTSREHILISNLFQFHWNEGKSLNLPALISTIQQPPFERIGVVDLDSFFPAKDRIALAMRLNNLLAAPGFDIWMKGEALNAKSLFYCDNGKPRLSVMSIAHLNDSERMFFITMLLNEIISWMRKQPGTGSLRAILYIDEIFGFMPPTANPASKVLLLTLLKQARAYGLGLVLATQNPVDLDYKGLSNIGTWFIGRLQTERDKARVMEGLEGASGDKPFNRSQMEQTLAGLGKRKFLLHNVHESEAVVFSTRWVLSYLAGPLTRKQIKSLMQDKQQTIKSQSSPTSTLANQNSAVQGKPMLKDGIAEFFLPVRQQGSVGSTLTYHPQLISMAKMHFSSARYKIDNQKNLSHLVELDSGPVPVDWSLAEESDIDQNDLQQKGIETASFADLPKPAMQAKNYTQWKKQYKQWLRTECTQTLYKSPTFKLVSEPAESVGDFRVRLQQLANEKRDIELAKVRSRFDKKLNTLENRLQRAQQKIETQQEQAKQSKFDTAISIGTALLGAFLGRKRVSSSSASRVGSAMKKASRMRKESGDVEHAQQQFASVQADIDELNRQFEQSVDQLDDKYDAQNEDLDEVIIRAKSMDIQIQLLGILWTPYYQNQNGVNESAF
ncbi:MAG: helicase HerA domain-containing protein [bacterium]